MANDVIENRSGKFWRGEDRIIRIIVSPTAEGTLKDAEENLVVFAKLCQGQKHLVLADIRNAVATNREQRHAYVRAKEIKFITALALVVGSPLSRIIAGFFLGMNKLPCPIQVFRSEEKAIQWLRGFDEENDRSKER